ncbi:hypothetical protein Tco_1174246 [Tanacetum coccineum]
MNDYEESTGIQEDSNSDLQSMPNDDLRSVSGFEAADSNDTHNNSQDDIASAERLSLLDHLDHICEEVCSLHSRLGNMESSIVQTIFDEIKSSLPALVTNALKEQLPGILSATLKDCLPLIVNKKVVKQLNRQFNISHVAQSNRFVTFQKELSKVIKSKVAKKVQVVRLKGVRKDLQSQTKHISKYSSSFQDMQTQLQDVKDLLESAGEHQIAENITPPEPTPETQGELAYNESTLPVFETKFNEDSAMVLYNPEKDLVDLITTEQDSGDDDDLHKQPLSKRFKIMHPILSKPQPSVKQFTNQLFGTTSSKFSPTPTREPTPPKDESKGKCISTKEPPKYIMPFIEEGGSVPKIPNLKSFILPEGTLSQEKFMAQLKEMKRLADLKEQEKKSEEELKILLNPATLRAQALKWEEHEEKKAKMLKEFNKYIFERTSPLPITKIIYVVNSSKTATMRITRDKDPLNLKSLMAKFQWVINQAKRLGLLPPPELATFGLTAKEKKKKD